MRPFLFKMLTVWVFSLTAFSVFSQNDLSLSVSTTSGTVSVGDAIQYTVTVNNQGATTVNDVEVSVPTVAGLNLTSTSVGGSFSGGVWDIGTIASGTASVSMTMNFTVTGEGVQTLQAFITNMAEIDGDSDPSDNSVLEDDYSAACVTAPFEYCAGETIDITATAPAGHNSYQWYRNNVAIGGATNQTLNITSAGNYRYEVNVGATGSCDGGSCCDIQVIENTLPTAGITNNTGVTEIDCNNPTISLTATGGDSYVWAATAGGTISGATNGANITATSDGTYTVTVTSVDGCTATADIDLTEDITAPTAGITNNTGVTEITCTTSAISLTATGGDSYVWAATLGGTIAGATNVANISATSEGTYTVTVTGTNGCTSTADIDLTEDIDAPTAGITNNTGITEIDCNNPAISLTATGGDSYVWAATLGGTIAGATNVANISATSAGTYTVTVTATNGCTATADIDLTEDIDAPTAGITNNTGVTEIDCSNPNISLTATGGDSYVWAATAGGTISGPTNDATISATSDGTYTVTVTATNGCTSTADIDLTEDLTAPTAGTTNNTGTTVLTCATTAISLTGTGGDSYSWAATSGGTIAGATDVANISATSAGLYTVTVTGTNGCTATSQTTITQDISTPTAGISNGTGTTELTCLVTSIDLTGTGGVSYEWSTTETTAAISVTSAGTYTVTVTGINGCTASSQTIITGSCEVDYADLPDGTAGNGPGDYNTTSANNGPSHGIVTNLTLGSSVDAESDGQPSTNGDGDDTDGNDDDDGLSIGSTFDVVPGGTIRIPYDGTNGTGNDANLVAWVDWNNDGVFSPGEQVTPIVVPGTGGFSGNLTVPVPEGATTGTNIGILIRLSNSPITSPDGYLSSGEVESYMLNVNCPTQICLPVTSTKN